MFKKCYYFMLYQMLFVLTLTSSLIATQLFCRFNHNSFSLGSSASGTETVNLSSQPMAAADDASLQDFIQSNPLIAFGIIFVLIGLIFTIFFILTVYKYRQELTEARLERSRADSKARQDFLSRMSHEIRTPMNAIIGLTDVITMHEDIPADLLESLNKIHSSAHYLLGLINNILDMSKIDQGKMILSKEPFSLGQTIISLEDMLESEAERFGVEFQIEKDIKNDVIIADEIRLRQVLTNLISNAFKYTPSGGKVSFKVLETAADEETASYYFEVKDNGIGIPRNEQERIFELFEQVESDISRNMGTGLGLPISQSIVHLMGGDIKLKSEKNKGSEFSFEITFPLGKIKMDEALQVDNRLEGKNILVVEDNEINAEIITSFLEVKGAIVQLATNGKEALEEFKNAPTNFYNLILMDIQMPVMDGLTSTKQIRMLDKEDAKVVPIIAMTANTFREDVDNALNAGMNDFIPKPIDVNNLYKVLNEFLVLE